jgi:hypothetical protein
MLELQLFGFANGVHCHGRLLRIARLARARFVHGDGRYCASSRLPTGTLVNVSIVPVSGVGIGDQHRPARPVEEKMGWAMGEVIEDLTVSKLSRDKG